MRSITDNITEDKLLEEIYEIMNLPMYADRKAKAHARSMAQQRRR
jgi:mRNA-capping enzyme